MPVATSPDLVHWDYARSARPGKILDALPELGSWAKEGFTWAPEVLAAQRQVSALLHRERASGECPVRRGGQRRDPKGPFGDSSTAPLLCQTELGGTIDASPFRDADGKLYLYFKNDGNRVHTRTSLWGQQLSSDGLKMVGQPVELLKDDQGWEQRVVEAPTMVRSPAGYQLFFSGGFFGWNTEEGGLSPYAMGYASCASPLGPCKAAAENPILHSFKEREAGCLSGPGHQSIFPVGARSFISFHAWEATSSCRKQDDRRYLYIAPIFWKDGKPQIGPSLR